MNYQIIRAIIFFIFLILIYILIQKIGLSVLTTIAVGWSLAGGVLLLSNKNLFNVHDILILSVFSLYCLLYFASIPKLGPLPFSPKYFVMIALFIALVATGNQKYISISRNIIQPLFLYPVSIILFGVCFLDIKIILPQCEFLFIIISTHLVVSRDENKCIILTRIISLLCLASAYFYIFGMLFYEQVCVVREILYSAYVDFDNPLTSLALKTPTGLTFNHAIMGYHMTAAMSLTGLLALVETRFFWKWFWRINCPIVLFASIASAERSIVVAVTASIIYFMLFLKTRILFIVIIVGSILLGGLSFSVISNYGSIDLENFTIKFEDKEFDTILSRLDTEDIGTRLKWQVAAIKIIISNPLGLRIADKTWEDESLNNGADYTMFGGRIMAVHNSYLGVMLKFGYLGIVMVVLSMTNLLKICKFIKNGYITNAKKFKYALVVSVTIIALSIQSMLHNASFFTNETISCLIVSMLLTWYDTLQSKRYLVIPG